MGNNFCSLDYMPNNLKLIVMAVSFDSERASCTVLPDLQHYMSARTHRVPDHPTTHLPQSRSLYKLLDQTHLPGHAAQAMSRSLHHDPLRVFSRIRPAHKHKIPSHRHQHLRNYTALQRSLASCERNCRPHWLITAKAAIVTTRQRQYQALPRSIVLAAAHWPSQQHWHLCPLLAL